MVAALLEILQTGKTYSLQELALRLNTDIPLVLAQLEYLQRQGYIQRVAPSPGCCSACPGCQGCRDGGPQAALPVMWELTKKPPTQR